MTHRTTTTTTRYAICTCIFLKLHVFSDGNVFPSPEISIRVGDSIDVRTAVDVGESAFRNASNAVNAQGPLAPNTAAFRHAVFQQSNVDGADELSRLALIGAETTKALRTGSYNESMG